MNCWIILLFLCCCNRNGREGIGEPGCGCEPIAPPKPPCRPRERERDCPRERDCDCRRECEAERESCPCGNESRFEPRFEARPFGNQGCGCDDK